MAQLTTTLDHRLPISLLDSSTPSAYKSSSRRVRDEQGLAKVAVLAWVSGGGYYLSVTQHSSDRGSLFTYRLR